MKEWLFQIIFNIQELGQGSYGKVIKAKNKHTKAIRAIKIIPKAKVKNHERFATEINI